MVTPPKATRVSQCTCKPGFGSTPNFPYSCQQCPIGTYANALGQIIGIPGVPPQGGKGVTRGLTGATILPCKPCCPGGVGTCSYTTLQPGSTSFNQCVLEPPPVPPVTGYCCGGVACATPVPEPPSNLPANARSADSIPEGPSQVQRERAQLLPPPNRVQPPGGRGDWPGGGNAMGGGGSSGGFSVNPQSRWWGNGGDDGDSDGGDARRPGALTVCSAQPRVAVADPTSGIAGNTPWLVLYWGDPTPGTSCPYKPGSLGVYGCTGSQLAPYLVLTAAHCVDPQMYDIAGCTDLRLVSITLCYGYTRPKSGSFVCPASKGVEAVGVSWYDHASATSPNDQAIVFASAAKPPPYYKYNYIENMPGVFTSQSNKFQALNYVGDGLAATKQCGCGVCDMPCGLAQTGPSSGPLTNDTHSVTAGNGAVNGQLEACGGSSGGCMTINGEACCMAVDSYEWIAATACTSACSSYWSTISAAKPLSDLWKTIRLALPQTLT